MEHHTIGDALYLLVSKTPDTFGPAAVSFVVSITAGLTAARARKHAKEAQAQAAGATATATAAGEQTSKNDARISHLENGVIKAKIWQTLTGLGIDAAKLNTLGFDQEAMARAIASMEKDGIA